MNTFEKGLTAGNVGTAAPRTPRYHLLDRDVCENLDMALALAERAENIADRIVGSQPEAPCGSAEGYKGNGIIDTLRSSASVTHERLLRIATALDRMEADLG